MSVLSFLLQIDICLIAYEYFMTAVTDIYCRRVNLVTVSKHDTMKIAAYKHRHRVGGTVRQSSVHHFFSCVYFNLPVTSTLYAVPSVRANTEGCIVNNGFLNLILYPPVK